MAEIRLLHTIVCDSCKRTTTTGLCGCPAPERRQGDPMWFRYEDNDSPSPEQRIVQFPHKLGLEREGWDIPPEAA
jgi:hypothetical protein